jgi:hypothetical protein
MTKRRSRMRSTMRRRRTGRSRRGRMRRRRWNRRKRRKRRRMRRRRRRRTSLRTRISCKTHERIAWFQNQMCSIIKKICAVSALPACTEHCFVTHCRRYMSFLWVSRNNDPHMSCAKSSAISERMYESYFRLVPLRHMLYVQHRDT